MTKPYWGLFWATGMPEVWLMEQTEPRRPSGPEDTPDPSPWDMLEDRRERQNDPPPVIETAFPWDNF